MELACFGTTISGSANGVQVASVQDETYREGRLSFGASSLIGARLTADARFDNLQVTEMPGQPSSRDVTAAAR